jgi:hypothetical protein
VTRPYTNPQAHDRDQAEAQRAEREARKRVTPPGQHAPAVNLEPPNIRWRILAQKLIDCQQDMKAIQTRDDTIYAGYTPAQRELARQAVAALGPLIGDAMREVRRKDERNEAAGKIAGERWDKFCANVVRTGRTLESLIEGDAA